MSNTFAGLPLLVSKLMPKGEVWMVQEGERSYAITHEGPHAGELYEEWFRKPLIVRIVNLGDWKKIPKISLDSR